MPGRPLSAGSLPLWQSDLPSIRPATPSAKKTKRTSAGLRKPADAEIYAKGIRTYNTAAALLGVPG